MCLLRLPSKIVHALVFTMWIQKRAQIVTSKVLWRQTTMHLQKQMPVSILGKLKAMVQKWLKQPFIISPWLCKHGRTDTDTHTLTHTRTHTFTKIFISLNDRKLYRGGQLHTVWLISAVKGYKGGAKKRHNDFPLFFSISNNTMANSNQKYFGGSRAI